MKLYIGNKNYSTWSLRAWILMKKSGISFEEVKLPLDTPQFYAALEPVTPTQKVPCLVDGEVTVWDSLAICEYINDIYLSGRAWPADKASKAKARALAAEMHSGFMALRNEMPMNIRAVRRVVLSENGQQDLQRIDQIFSQQMDEYADRGGWLFGEFSITDAMYIPVVLRLITYQMAVSDGAQKYVDHVMACDALKAWLDEGLKETEIVECDEAGEAV
ncbi:Stringent starvation protein A [Vibrio aerogenes CECT 7868]|uniref:Stringent starvation protein A n=1 Tax=Vibrio aerogenes CECT 7868 TaxID=1216006 RepID=A0A1M5ZYM5_9VIBR|nr:glutathione S-transferase family protein [Vibrio aerogenes]SHI29375.1 Stringent starvation protein A [Vibrio aerogenes CECT 7868]